MEGGVTRMEGEPRSQVGLLKFMGAVRMILVSLLVCNSSSRESRPWEIAGLKEDSVQLHNSVPYLCFSKWGREGWMSCSQVKTMKILRDGVSSLSTSGI